MRIWTRKSASIQPRTSLGKSEVAANVTKGRLGSTLLRPGEAAEAAALLAPHLAAGAARADFLRSLGAYAGRNLRLLSQLIKL